MILVHAAGNENIGLGNLTRGFEIAKYISRNVSEELVVIFECSSDIAKQYVVENTKIYISDSREDSREIIKKLCIGISTKTNIVISDLVDMSYEDNVFYKQNGFNKLVQLNDSNVRNVIPDIYINSDAFHRKFQLSTKIKVTSGSKYVIIKESLKSKRRREFVPINKIVNVLICFGGSDPAGYTENCIYEILNNDRYDQYKFNVVLGMGFGKNRIENILNNNKENINYIINERNMGDRILDNDVVITLGGLTTYEALFLGKPVMAMGWNYMKYYVDNLAKSRLIYNLGSSKENFKYLYNSFSNIDELNKLALNGFKTINGEGTKNIVEFILKNR